jgi:hypothetical protein
MQGPVVSGPMTVDAQGAYPMMQPEIWQPSPALPSHTVPEQYPSQVHSPPSAVVETPAF